MGKPLKVLELFAGESSICRAFRSRGHEAYSVEWDKRFDGISLYDDVNNLTIERVMDLCGGLPDIVWASPDCTTYSTAGISHHRRKNRQTGELEPVSDYAKFCDKTNRHMLSLIKQIDPIVFFIENPRGGMRKMSFMSGINRHTVTYCQYGDFRMKPTDIWTNHPHPNFKPPCKNGSKCHQAAPRGSRTGTQGINGSRKRSVIPKKLCEYIVDISEELVS